MQLSTMSTWEAGNVLLEKGAGVPASKGATTPALAGRGGRLVSVTEEGAD